jgi:hypothetical protein
MRDGLADDKSIIYSGDKKQRIRSTQCEITFQQEIML